MNWVPSQSRASDVNMGACKKETDKIAKGVKVDAEVKGLGFGTVQLFVFEIGSHQIALAGLELIIQPGGCSISNGEVQCWSGDPSKYKRLHTGLPT